MMVVIGEEFELITVPCELTMDQQQLDTVARYYGLRSEEGAEECSRKEVVSCRCKLRKDHQRALVVKR